MCVSQEELTAHPTNTICRSLLDEWTTGLPRHQKRRRPQAVAHPPPAAAGDPRRQRPAQEQNPDPGQAARFCQGDLGPPGQKRPKPTRNRINPLPYPLPGIIMMPWMANIEAAFWRKAPPKAGAP